MLRSKILAKAAFFLALAIFPAKGEDAASYPSHTIKMLVAFPPGGGPDPLARIVASGLERRLGQPVIVENLPGGSGALAARAASRAAPDGYTLLFADMSFVVAPHTVANFGVEPLKEFDAIGWAATSPFSMIVSASLPVSNVTEFITLAKAKPDEILFAHAGIGTTPHLGAAAFAKAAGLNPRYIAYRGIADAMTNAMTGIISALFSAGGTAINAAGNDKLKVLGVTGDHRMVQLPNVPTFAESGITMRGFEYGAWYGLVTPVGTPQPIIAKINAALNTMKTDADVNRRFISSGAEFKEGTPKDYQDFLIEQDALWGAMLNDMGVKPE